MSFVDEDGDERVHDKRWWALKIVQNLIPLFFLRPELQNSLNNYSSVNHSLDVGCNFNKLFDTIRSSRKSAFINICKCVIQPLVMLDFLSVSAGYRIALQTWKEKSAGPLHALHMGYSIGSIAVPQLVAPFLDSRLSGGVIETGYNSSCNTNHSQITTTTQTAEPKFHSYDYDYATSYEPITPKYPANFVTAYWTLSGLSLTISLIFTMYHIHGQRTGIKITKSSCSTKIAEKQSFRQTISPRSCSPTRPSYAVLIIALLLFYYIISVPLIRAFTKFIFSYGRDGPCFTVTEATGLESAYFAAVTVGRLCAFLSSTVIHMKYILQVNTLTA